MSVVEFELPEELKGVTYETTLAQMLKQVPEKYDKIEGGFVFDMIAPAALEAAELVQLWLALGIKINFHMWATDRWLDYHASNCGLERRAATHSYGELSIVTDKAVTFKEGFIFSVPSENGEAAIDFETVTDTTIDGEGTLRVRSVLGGRIGNVAANMVAIMKNPLKNVVSITNEGAIIGGTEAESDESLRKRIDDFYAGLTNSFIGNLADYRRWALSVPGVGYVHVAPTTPLDNGIAKIRLYDAEDNLIENATLEGRIKMLLNAAAIPNSVKIVLADEEGNPAVDEICLAVETKIFGKGHDDMNRLAPIGIASYEVIPFQPVKINVSMEAVLSEEATLVKKRISDALREYFKTLADDELNYGILKYVQVSSVLSKVSGLDDFKHLRISKGNATGSLENIVFGADELPVVGKVIFS